jgi:FkbM family methyltransferase
MGVEDRVRDAYDMLHPGRRRDRRDRLHQLMVMAFTLRRDSNCIDVGAADGHVLREMIRLAPDGRHIAYEPLPAFAGRLKSEFPGVDVRQAALSNECGEAPFTHVADDPGYSGLRRRSYPRPWVVEEITVRTETLDQALPSDYVPHLIKMDVVGAERQVLEGARETLARHGPIVMFEHGAGAADHYGTSSSDVFDILSAVGLRIFDIDGRGPYSAMEFDEVFDRALYNFVARR